MSIKQKESEQIPFMVYGGFVCDKCGDDYDDDDFIQEQEGLFKTDIGGYGSVWGDGTCWSISLCQDCAHEILSPYAKKGKDWIEHYLDGDK